MLDARIPLAPGGRDHKAGEAQEAQGVEGVLEALEDPELPEEGYLLGIQAEDQEPAQGITEAVMMMPKNKGRG